MAGKVLVADDSLKIQKQLTEMLKEAGIQVVSVSNGEHAVRKLSEVKPDLVLADLFMPVRSGYEVCEFIKNSEDFSHIAVLLLASTLEPFDEKEAARVRADGKLDKPFTAPDEALATIQEFLKGAMTQPAVEPAPEPQAAAAEPEPEPEPEPEVPAEFDVAPSQPAVRFDDASARLSFTDMLEESSPSESEPVAATDENATEIEISPPSVAETEESAAPTQGNREVEQPELAAPWEMTGPDAAAPEVPAAGGWESQWSDESPESAPATESRTEEAAIEAAPPDSVAEAGVQEVVSEEVLEEAAPVETAREFEPVTGPLEEATVVEEPAPEPPPPAKRTMQEEIGTIFGTAALQSAQEAVARMTAEQGRDVDPEVVERVVAQVLERLSPQVMETIARELVRPLAESLLKQQLKE